MITHAAQAKIAGAPLAMVVCAAAVAVRRWRPVCRPTADASC